jgi:hypothetical protein
MPGVWKQDVLRSLEAILKSFLLGCPMDNEFGFDYHSLEINSLQYGPGLLTAQSNVCCGRLVVWTTEYGEQGGS